MNNFINFDVWYLKYSLLFGPYNNGNTLKLVRQKKLECDQKFNKIATNSQGGYQGPLNILKS